MIKEIRKLQQRIEETLHDNGGRMTLDDLRKSLEQSPESIDREIAETDPCPECGSAMHYESIRTETSYRAFSVCNKCGERIEF